MQCYNPCLLWYSLVSIKLTCKGACGQVESAKGRYLVSHGSTFSTKLLSEVLSKRFPQFKFPAGENTPSKEVLSSAKACPRQLPINSSWHHPNAAGCSCLLFAVMHRFLY